MDKLTGKQVVFSLFSHLWCHLYYCHPVDEPSDLTCLCGQAFTEKKKIADSFQFTQNNLKAVTKHQNKYDLHWVISWTEIMAKYP